MKMRVFLVVLLLIIMAISLTACGDSEPTEGHIPELTEVLNEDIFEEPSIIKSLEPEAITLVTLIDDYSVELTQDVLGILHGWGYHFPSGMDNGFDIIYFEVTIINQSNSSVPIHHGNFRLFVEGENEGRFFSSSSPPTRDYLLGTQLEPQTSVTGGTEFLISSGDRITKLAYGIVHLENDEEVWKTLAEWRVSIEVPKFTESHAAYISQESENDNLTQTASPILCIPDFTHILENGLGFVVPDNWSVETHGESVAFILVDGNQMAINLVSSEGIRHDLREMLFVDMVENTFNGENVEIRELARGEVGYAVFRASYTTTLGGSTFTGIGFLIADEEWIAITNGVMMTDTNEVITAYYDFIASIRFAN